MNTGARFSRDVLWVWVLLAPAAGCAVLDLPDPPVADIAQKRQQRTEEVVREFESKRDLAEMQAALAHWKQGDVEACEEGLRRLLERNPDHREARLLMAKVRLADNPPRAAFNRVERPPLPDAAGEDNSTLDYYERVAGLEPDSEPDTVGRQTAPQAAEQAGASSGGAAGPPDDSSQASPAPALAVPDSTALTPDPTQSLAGHGRNCPKKAAAADDSVAPADDTVAPADDPAQPLTTSRRTSHTETTDRVDPADPADSGEAAQPDRVRALLDRGRAALAEGSSEAALVHFRKAAAIRPNNPQIPIAAALAALRDNRPDLAIELLRPAERRFSGSAQLYRILGVAYYRLGDLPSSQVALRQALSLDKSSALSYFLMGCTLSKLGQSESAKVHLRQARTINPRYTLGR